MKVKELWDLMSPREGDVSYYDPLKYPMDIPSKRLIGIEVEVENTQLKSLCHSGIWIKDQDGSLRNDGTEWISHPIPASYAQHALAELLDGSLSNECCFSPRTSIHVHVNSQDLTTNQVINATLLYAAFEPLFYAYTGRGRAKNIYCVPLYDTGLITGINSQSLVTTVESWEKYTGYNLLPLCELGTIEFRHMHGTFDYEKVSVWIRMITNLIDYAATTKDISSIILSMNSTFDYNSLLEKIFGEDSSKLNFKGYHTIAHSVDTLKQAFIQISTLGNIIPTMIPKAPYFVGVQ